ncbi:hypothetical protein OPV22_025855 [Ensete ventricosum]|uniref:Uncharacterized protein n=1 Tax=Ensete ventricosum TaxID=4639 RepID=A0AAV8QIJ1_ENSVE|nr:hypothetical protein OPV22_025855 [Ensete ventricosum]
MASLCGAGARHCCPKPRSSKLGGFMNLFISFMYELRAKPVLHLQTNNLWNHVFDEHSINSMHKTLAQTHSSQDKSRFFFVGEVGLGEKTWRGFLPASVKERIKRNQGKLQVFFCFSNHHESQRVAYFTSRDRDMTRAGTVCDRVDWHTKCRRADEALISSSAVMVQADTTRMRIPPWI